VERLVKQRGLGPRAIARELGVPPTTVHRDLVALRLAGGQERERPASVPPAPAGNSRAMVHGLGSAAVTAAVIEPRARELAPRIIDAHPHLDARRDGPAVTRLAFCYARLEHAYRWFAEQPDELFKDRENGTVHGLLGRVTVWEASAGAQEERLAITPRERARLKLDRLGAAGAALTAGKDLSRLSDDELAEFERLAAKAAAIDGEAVTE
jgi:hypothetical protein